MSRPKLLVFIVTYNAEKSIEHVLRRIPTSLSNCYDTEILVIDDASQDGKFENGDAVVARAIFRIS